MKIQRLGALDIYLLAKELNISLTGKTILDITARKSDIYFEFPDIGLCFKVISGSPYFVAANKPLNGRNWLGQIKGGIIKSVNQVAGDRLIMFEIAFFNRLGKRKDFCLYFEFYKNGNIILTDTTNRVLAELRRGEKTGGNYEITKPEGLDVLAIDQRQSLTSDEIEEIKSLRILQFAAIPESDSTAIIKLVNKIKDKSEPHIIKDQSDHIIGFSVYGPPFNENVNAEPTAGVLEAITLYSKAWETSKPASSTDYNKRLLKAQKKLEAIQAELAEAEKFAIFRQYGEIILANLNKISKGRTECTFTDPYSDKNKHIKIPLDKSLSPEKNAARYFDIARKLEKGVPIIGKRLAKHKAEIARFKEMEAELAADEQSAETDLPFKKIERRNIPFRNIKLDGGWQVYLGKSASTNDELTFSFARNDDIWFHAWQAFGSHLILRPPQKGAIPDNKIIQQAASLAAYFSKAKHSGKVPVIYTEARYVRKVKKVLGKVTYTNEKSLMVKPKRPEQISESN